MTPRCVKQEIEGRFYGLISSGMLKVTVKGRTLKLSGSISAVQAMDLSVMDRYVPNRCKPILKLRNDAGQMVYTYRFEGGSHG